MIIIRASRKVAFLNFTINVQNCRRGRNFLISDRFSGATCLCQLDQKLSCRLDFWGRDDMFCGTIIMIYVILGPLTKFNNIWYFFRKPCARVCMFVREGIYLGHILPHGNAGLRLGEDILARTPRPLHGSEGVCERRGSRIYFGTVLRGIDVHLYGSFMLMHFQGRKSANTRFEQSNLWYSAHLTNNTLTTLLTTDIKWWRRWWWRDRLIRVTYNTKRMSRTTRFFHIIMVNL